MDDTVAGPAAPMAAGPSPTARLVVAIGCAVLAGLFVLWLRRMNGAVSDMDQLWYAARALREGRPPYDAVGPGREFEWPWPLLYPMPAVLAFVPLTFVPPAVASLCVAMLSVGVFTYAITRHGFALLPLLVSASVFDCVRTSQPVPIFTAGLLLPSALWLVTLKPTLGVAFCLATESRRGLLTAVCGGGVLLAVSFWMQPTWWHDWLATLPSATHMRIPLTTLGGPVLVLALLRWRRLDARVLLACACIPHTPMIYDVVPLALVARTFRDALLYAVLTLTALVVYSQFGPALADAQAATRAARVLNLFVYLPLLVMVLRRPNEGEPPAWVGLMRDALSWRARRTG